MNTEDELSRFRNEWREELQYSQSNEEKGRELYFKGVDLERQGYCYEAIEYYRQACKLVPDIEQQIDVSCSTSNNSPSVVNIMGDGVGEGTSEDLVAELSPDQSGLLNFDEVSCEPAYSQRGTHIAKLPTEIMMIILRYVVSTELDMRSVEIYSSVCKWFFKLARSADLWRSVCEMVWPGCNYNEYGSWRLMFITKPHLRFDGIYISRIKYYREGEKRLYSCTLQTVFYHRYFRFFPDGLVLGLNSPSPPQQSVASLQDRISNNKNVMYGKYKICGDRIEMSLLHRDFRNTTGIYLQPENSFHVVLKLCSKDGRHALKWVEYYIISKSKRDNIIIKDTIELDSEHFCKFYFGRVKSYTAQSSGLV